MNKLFFVLMIFVFIGCGPAAELGDNNAEPAEFLAEEPAGLPVEEIDGSFEILQEVFVEPGQPFSMSSQVFKLAHGVGQQWHGCDQKAIVTGGYSSDTQCGKGYFHPKFAEHLNKNFFSCVEQASFVAGMPQPSRVYVRHLGTYSDRRARGSTSLSMHAYARALDLEKFILADIQGGVTQVVLTNSFYTGKTAKFYDGFRQCWKETLPATCVPGQREFNGSVGHPGSKLGGNTLHLSHIHLSFPFCAE